MKLKMYAFIKKCEKLEKIKKIRNLNFLKKCCYITT